ncbi:MAG: Ig-like domain-containing protein [Methanobrevibacter sp.]|nr:Ig-like domain-containing protein [Methanobrevibacter sp.]
MKIRKIMLITFLLLAVLAIGTVSASDDVASDNLTVSDDADVIEEDDYDSDEYYIDADEDEICIDIDDEEYDEEYEVASIVLPLNTNGSFQIFNNEEVVARSDVNENDEDHWYEDDGDLCGSILLKDINLTKINDGDELSFKFFEVKEGKYVPIDSFTKKYKVSLDETTIKLSEIGDEEDVEVEYGDLDIIMTEGWQDEKLLEFIVRKDITGKIKIYLNDTVAFEKDLSNFTADPEDDEDFNHYIILVGDLNINQPGEYVIQEYLDNENGTHIYQYDEEEPGILVLYEPQTMTVGDVTIDVTPLPTTIDENESLITIDATASEDDEILIYVDGNETPLKVNIGECKKDDFENYFISAKQLNLSVGKHDLKITYKEHNLNAKVNLASKLIIELPKKDEIIYTTFNDIFVLISLDEEDIYEYGISGTINLTIINSNGNTVATLEKDIDQISYDTEQEALVIYTEDMEVELNGNYTVTVRYFDGNEAETQVSGLVTFKSFEPEYCGTSIQGIVKNENDTVITFINLPLRDYVLIKIDGNEPIKIDESTLEDCFDSENGVYYIKYDKIKEVADGPHSINVYIESNNVRIDLANGTLLVDLEKNIDPELTITVSNIEEGNAANVIIKTNASFTGEITLQVANKNYTVNVVNGQATISIPGLTANTYTATAFLKSDGIFNDSIKTATFTVISKAVPPVKKADVIKLTLKKVKVKKSAKKLVLKATLKINGKAVKGKTITFKFNGKTYKAKTNKKGVAKATIKKKVLKKLKVGKKVTYTAKYLTKTVKKTVKVKK